MSQCTENGTILCRFELLRKWKLSKTCRRGCIRHDEPDTCTAVCAGVQLHHSNKIGRSMQSHTDFPSAFAIVDGSLIAVAAVQHEVEHVMMSRKQFHAINTQFVIDANMRLLSVNARYGGALIWRASLVNTCLRRLCSQMGSEWVYYMLADNSYPLQPWLLKPYDNPKLLNIENFMLIRSIREIFGFSLGLI